MWLVVPYIEEFPPLPVLITNDQQEIRNITWIAECIAQSQKDRIGNFISVF